MGFLAWLISLVFTGLVVGALGRLAIPGPNPMSIGRTILVGIGGAFAGGIVAAILGAGDALTFILMVLGAAAIIWFLQRRRTTA